MIMYKEYSSKDALHKDITDGVLENYTIEVNPSQKPTFYLGVLAGNGIPSVDAIKDELRRRGFNVAHCVVTKFVDNFEV